jgi:cyclophilin family peptidyl-prolyl cis-trans isomerase/HEAT repeat protein
MQFRKRVGTLALFLVCASAQAQRGASGATPDDLALYARLLAMTDTRQLDTALVDHALSSHWSPLRGAATLAIGQIGSEHGLAGAVRLRELLTDNDLVVASNAAYALGLLRDSGSVSALATALNRDRAISAEAAWALGEIGTPARPELIRQLQTRQPTNVSIQLLLAAAKLRPLPLAEVRPYLRGPQPQIAWAAAYAIARTRAAAGVRDLIGLIDLPVASPTAAHLGSSTYPYDDSRISSDVVRAEIARGLARSAAGDSLASQSLAVLTRLATDPDPHVRINALRSLGTYKSEASSLIARATRDADPNVRIAAAQSLSAFTKNGDEFSTLWNADTSIVYRSSLLASAVRAGVRPPQLRQWASSPDWRLRAAIAGATGDSLDRSFAIARVAPLLRDPDPRVREAAYGALTPSASMPLEDSVHALLLTGLKDPDFYVRATVVGALAERPSVADLSPVLASYRKAATDSANDARLAAIQYVASLWKTDSVSLATIRRAELSSLPTPSDPLERAAGKPVAVWSGWGLVVPTPRPRAWYDSLVRVMVLPVLAGKSINATINTVRGPIRLQLFGADAPATVWNFLALARSGYYRNTRFHRVVPNFVAQDGDPRDDGNGGPGYSIRDEMNRHRYERGAVGMALSGPDTGGSQYFITHSPQPHLDGHYTVFGRVVHGYDVLDKIVQGDLITRIDPQ